MYVNSFICEELPFPEGYDIDRDDSSSVHTNTNIQNDSFLNDTTNSLNYSMPESLYYPDQDSNTSNFYKAADSSEIIFDSANVTERFNTFFCNIATNLVNKLPHRIFNMDDITNYREKDIMPDSFAFTVVTESKVSKLLLSLNKYYKVNGH